jgi:hypothetical protein
VNQKDSSRVAREMAAAYGRLPGRPIHPDAALNAVFAQVYEFLPAEAVAAVIKPGPGDRGHQADPWPIVAALAGAELYLLECLAAADSGVVGSSCQLVHLEPGRARVEVETRYRGAQTGPESPVRETVWRFDLPGERTLTIETITSPDGELDDSERLARALAQGLGWQADGGW